MAGFGLAGIGKVRQTLRLFRIYQSFFKQKDETRFNEKCPLFTQFVGPILVGSFGSDMDNWITYCIRLQRKLQQILF